MAGAADAERGDVATRASSESGAPAEGEVLELGHGGGRLPIQVRAGAAGAR